MNTSTSAHFKSGGAGRSGDCDNHVASALIRQLSPMLDEKKGRHAAAGIEKTADLSILSKHPVPTTKPGRMKSSCSAVYAGRHSGKCPYINAGGAALYTIKTEVGHHQYTYNRKAVVPPPHSAQSTYLLCQTGQISNHSENATPRSCGRLHCSSG